MITVMQLLSHNLFQKFNLISDTSGLYNSVSGTSIFDWESKEDIESTFSPGDFVLTTLSVSKENTTTPDEYLRYIIDKQVAAIAIKNVHNHQISEETIDYANLHHVPIFIFMDTYIDDLIYIIKNSLITDSMNALQVNLLRKMMATSQSTEVDALARELNPFFLENCTCCCCIPKAVGAEEKTVNDYYRFYYQHLNLQHSTANASHVLVKGKKCFFLIFSSDSNPTLLQDQFLQQISALEISEKTFRIGLSNSKTQRALMNQALWEALYSAVSCQIDNRAFYQFEEIGINQFLMAESKSDWVKKYYAKIYNRLTHHDKKHNSNLHDTLVQYIKSGGDIILTAEKMFQHSNTIRYRLSKIKDVMGIRGAGDEYIQMHLYVQLYEINRHLCIDDLI